MLALISIHDFALRYLPPAGALALFAALAIPTVAFGLRSLNWMPPARKWSIIGFRLVLLQIIVLLLAGVEYVRESKDLEVMLVTDESASTHAAIDRVSDTLDSAVKKSQETKPAGDRVGEVSFDSVSRVDALPSIQWHSNGAALRDPTSGTDIASAVRLASTCFTGDAMKRLVLVSDGNATQGDLDSAVSAAAGAHIPIDVIPLHYAIRDEVMVDRIVAPVWRRQGEVFHIDVLVRVAGDKPVEGDLTVTRQGLPVDLDPRTPGIQPSLPKTLHAGMNVIHVELPPTADDGLHRFRATFTPKSGDTMPGNNSAEAFTFVRGKGRVLYVDNYPDHEGDLLLQTLRAAHVGITDADHISAAQFPDRLIDLQSYDAIILANVPRGPGGISDQQGQMLAQYTRDTGGGLIVVGGPDALGAGNWQGTELAKVLPVDLEVPAERAIPAGALVLAIDHSGSMAEPMPGGGLTTKMQSAKESALLAVKTMNPRDYLGVVEFDSRPDWVLPLDTGRDLHGVNDVIRTIQPAGGTSIYPALDEAGNALAKITPGQAPVKHVLLLTDGRSEPGDFSAAVARMRANKITLSTIAVGGDADLQLLGDLATRGGGRMYAVNDPTQLTQVFIREARIVRRSLIQENEKGIDLAMTPSAGDTMSGFTGQALPPLLGMVLTSRRNDPQVENDFVVANKYHDPVLATWQIGLGRCTVFTGDATLRWSHEWAASDSFQKLWADMLRSVTRPPISGDFEVATVRDGNKTTVRVEALSEAGNMNGLSIAGSVAAPDGTSADVHLQQTGPGTYEATVPTPQAGTYVAAMQYRSPTGTRGTLLAGVVATTSPEQRDLSSNDAQLASIAARTGGRVLPALDANLSYDLFDRAGLSPSRAYLPLNWLLLPLAAGILIGDVAMRRLQIDRSTAARARDGTLAFVRSFTTVRKPETTGALAALRTIKGRAAEAEKAAVKFEAPPDLPQGDITNIVGGATAEPPKRAAAATPSTPAAGVPGDGATTSNLLEAKRRAQQKMREQEDRNS